MATRVCCPSIWAYALLQVAFCKVFKDVGINPGYTMTNTCEKSKVVVPASKKRKTPGATSSSYASFNTRIPFLRFPQASDVTHNEPDTITFRLSGTMHHISIPEFGAALELNTDEFMSVESFLTLYRHIHYSCSLCWVDLTLSTTPYDAS
ncbi:hypothetical protein PVK06_002490 [Gossypium arboreum]|uniref:Uncharacterized protein n=1 Tax=Gossypium arboreum TaxID=29729 RepID=A0ABR0R4X6_GOSAR|nr:hypothetical protein PVK06_002490 [Gossypium arboreum]